MCPLLPDRHNSDSVVVPDDHVFRKVGTSIAPRDKSFLIYTNHGILIPPPVMNLGRGIGQNPS